MFAEIRGKLVFFWFPRHDRLYPKAFILPNRAAEMAEAVKDARAETVVAVEGIVNKAPGA